MDKIKPITKINKVTIHSRPQPKLFNFSKILKNEMQLFNEILNQKIISISNDKAYASALNFCGNEYKYQQALIKFYEN